MPKTLFSTKIMDGIVMFTVALLVMAGSLYVDAMKGLLHGRMLRVSIYLEGSSVDGMLTEGNRVTAYRRSIGHIDRVSFFTVEVLRRTKIGMANLDSVPGTRAQMARIKALQRELAFQPTLVTGVKLTVMLYENVIGPLLPLFGPSTDCRIVSAGMFGEPYLQLNPVSEGRGLEDGDKLSFPKNDVLTSPQAVSAYGTELMMPADVLAARKRIEMHRARVAEFELLLERLVAADEYQAAIPAIPPPGRPGQNPALRLVK